MKKLFGILMLTACIFSSVLFAEATPAIVRSSLYDNIGNASIDFSFDRSIEGQLGISELVQTAGDSTLEREEAAMSHPDYPVTPGDILKIDYSEAQKAVSLLSQVSSDYTISINSFGQVDGEGKSYEEVKRAIIEALENYLPFSNPAVTLVSAGTFTVTVTGEVDSTVRVPAWGLSRLSSTVAYANDFASTRNVSVISSDGTVTDYDLFRALREGDLDQDPLLKRGDVVRFNPSGKVIMVAGEVRRPGVYQLTRETSLSDAVNEFADGYLPTAGVDGYSIRRYSDGSVSVLPIAASDADTTILQDYDTVFIPPVAPSSRAVTVEGAIQVGTESIATGQMQSSGRLYYQFYPGETVTQMVQNLSDRFSAVSDLENMYVKRDGTIYPVNVRDILLGRKDANGTLELAEGDVFVVPFSQLFVHVAGGVVSPGIYPYIPDKYAMYYINLAGGFDPAKNRNGKYTVLNSFGEREDSDSLITPESVITAKLNTFQAVNGANLATTVTITGLVATILTIVVSIAGLTN